MNERTETASAVRRVCPYCGSVSAGEAGSATASVDACQVCRGLFDPLSKQASQNAMGPWFVRDEGNPFRPGCSLTTLRQLAVRGRIKADTVLRGPSTRQFWTSAARTPGVAHLLGTCHSCGGFASGSDVKCAICGASFEVSDDRQHLGLGQVRLLPGEASAERVAQSAGAIERETRGSESRATNGQPSRNEVGGDPVPLAPDPEALVGQQQFEDLQRLQAAERAAKLMKISEAERRAQRALREGRERAQKRNVVVGVVGGVMLLLLGLAIVAALPSGGAGGAGAAPAGGGVAGPAAGAAPGGATPAPSSAPVRPAGISAGAPRQ